MSEDKLYMETGELPPQGIGPDKAGKKQRKVSVYRFRDVLAYTAKCIRRKRPVVSGTVLYDDHTIAGSVTSLCDDGFYRFGEWRYPKLWELLDIIEKADLETTRVDFTVHFTGTVDEADLAAFQDFLRHYPKVDCVWDTPETGEQEGVGDED